MPQYSLFTRDSVAQESKRENKKIIKKEEPSYSQSTQYEAPFYASLKRGSYTVEAMIVLPLFITLMMYGVFFFRILQVQAGVQAAIDSATRVIAVASPMWESEQEDEIGTMAGAITYATLKIAEDEVPTWYIRRGIVGMDFSKSSAKGNYVDINVTYEMGFPIGLLGKYSFEVTQEARSRKWTGFDPSENRNDTEYVYITAYGTVYHTNYDCTYLNPSIKKVSASSVNSKRNKSGAKYYCCKACKGNDNDGSVYITDYGTLYHSKLSCSRLKRSVKKVPLEEVQDIMPKCNKCDSKDEE